MSVLRWVRRTANYHYYGDGGGEDAIGYVLRVRSTGPVYLAVYPFAFRSKVVKTLAAGKRFVEKAIRERTAEKAGGPKKRRAWT
jgi:hypothetical protein